MANILLNFFNLFPPPEPTPENRPSEAFIEFPELDACFESQIFDAVNQHRTSLKLPPLKLASEISDIARIHSQWLCTTDFWEGEVGHSGSDDRAKQVRKLGFREIRENIGTSQVIAPRYQTDKGQKTTANIILAHWIASKKGHREAIEERESTHTGIGVLSCSAYDEDGAAGFIVYVTQLFGR